MKLFGVFFIITTIFRLHGYKCVDVEKGEKCIQWSGGQAGKGCCIAKVSK